MQLLLEADWHFDLSDPRPLYLHTVESLCADLISGRPVLVGADNKNHSLSSESARSALGWYFKNRSKWGGNVAVADLEAITDAAQTKPIEIPDKGSEAQGAKRSLTLVKAEAHRFGGLHGYSDNGRDPETFVFEPTKALTVLEGWNGSGKTSILNAVIWALTGQILRPQRKPEETAEEFACRIAAAGAYPTQHKITAITPLPDNRFPPDLSSERIPLDTWVELTFADETGKHLPPIRRTHTRTNRGTVTETPANIASLGLAPIAPRIGTSIPGLLPFIQLGSASEFGEAIAQLTGLAELVDLSKHATRARERIEKELTKRKLDDIDADNEAFCQAKNDLQALISETPAIASATALPDPAKGDKLEDALAALVKHFTDAKADALKSAKEIIGDQFDPSDKASRDSLEADIGPAIAQLREIGRYPTAARLGALGRLTEAELEAVETFLDKIRGEAQTLAELASAPDVAKRKQLYARVAEWMKGVGDSDLANCKLCGSDLAKAFDAATKRPVTEEMKEALAGDAELISHTIDTWATARMGKLAEVLPETLLAEMKVDLPPSPKQLLLQALTNDLFATEALQGVLKALKPATDSLATKSINGLPEIEGIKSSGIPASLGSATKGLERAIARTQRAVQFARWQVAGKDAVNAAILAVTTKNIPEGEALSAASPLGVKLVALRAIVDGALPINNALELCSRMSTALKKRRNDEKRIEQYKTAATALVEVIDLGSLAQAQVESLRKALDMRATFWRKQIYNNPYSESGFELIGSDMNSKGALDIYLGAHGASAPAQHIGNASALRASLVGFYLAFWEYVQLSTGGLRILLLDDPQELLDDLNRDRLARTFPKLIDIGAQIIVTTHSAAFARISVAEARKEDLVEHRSVHPVNATRRTVSTAPAIEELDRKRDAFEKNKDDATKAQDYVAETRSFVEGRLADFFDDPAYPAFSTTTRAPTLADYVGKLRGLVSGKVNEFFSKKAVKQFSEHPGLKEGSSCLTLLNKAHHADKSKITYSEVVAEVDKLRSLRTEVEVLHEEFRRWKWRDSPATLGTLVPLKVAICPKFAVEVHPDLAAFTGVPSKGGSQAAVTEYFESSWFEGKSFFYLKNDNMGFAAPATSIVVVESDPKPGNDRNLVIAMHKGDTLARRLLRPQTDAVALALAAQTPDPRKSPPTRLVDPSEVQIHRVLGVLFDDLPPPPGKQEAVQVEEAPSLKRIATAYRVRDESALPLALEGQIVLGGPPILPAAIQEHVGAFVALTLADGSSILKRVGPALSGIKSARLFESIGGLGASEVIALEEVEDQAHGLRVMSYARLVLGVIYE
ncbi:ATP-binding protein [Bradyrhizobium oligotrophicum]|uniref:ATP-binding protein n=1 Tax=Bradyrhizobium oligotrophicum TaxID=44255 RepID=UPI003EB9034C